MVIETVVRPFYKKDCGLTSMAIDAGYEPQAWHLLKWCYTAWREDHRGVQTLVGYFTWEAHDKYVELTQFAVHPEWRREGIGRDMMTRFIGQCSAWKVAKIVIPESWLAGQLFLRATGWKCVSFVGDDEEGKKMVFNRRLPE